MPGASRPRAAHGRIKECADGAACTSAVDEEQEEKGESMNHRIERIVLGAKAMPFEPPSAERDRERLRRFEAGSPARAGSHEHGGAGSVGVAEVSARVIVAVVLLAAGVFLALSMWAPDNPDGWPLWVGVPALALVAQALRMFQVEERSPWGSDRG